MFSLAKFKNKRNKLESKFSFEIFKPIPYPTRDFKDDDDKVSSSKQQGTQPVPPTV